MTILTLLQLPFRKDRGLFLLFRRLTGYWPHDLAPYRQALMHKSLSGGKQSNERLEFLGDAILDAVVGDVVYRRFPNRAEGFLTNTRSKIVQRETLGRVGHEMGLGRLIKTGGRVQHSHNSYVEGNAFEALVGALYLDRGYGACLRFVERELLGKHVNINKVARQEQNWKSKVIEWSQKRKVTCTFESKEDGRTEGGSPVFESEVVVDGKVMGKGRGYSKRESQQRAAREALKKLRSLA